MTVVPVVTALTAVTKVKVVTIKTQKLFCTKKILKKGCKNKLNKIKKLLFHVQKKLQKKL